MPFLYQTRTLYRLTRTARPVSRALVRSAGIHSTPYRKHRVSEDIPFELPPDVQLPISPDVNDSGAPKDTITPAERLAFKSIFQEIAEKGEKPIKPKEKNVIEESDVEPKLPSFLEALQQSGDDLGAPSPTLPFHINSIMQDAAIKYNKEAEPGIRGLDPSSPLESTYSAAEREYGLLKFPRTIRKAARVAIGMFSSVRDTPVRLEGGETGQLGQKRSGQQDDPVDAVHTEERLAKVVETEAHRRAEWLRIREQMDAARTDVELWEVMERELFPLVERLGLMDAEAELQPSPKVKPKRGRKPKSSTPEIEPVKSSLDPEVYGPIYPMLLLESLKLFDTKFSRSSPYVFHVLPRVKQLGLLSYVLGVSTTFYNQLITTIWNRYGDAAAVLNLLEEMRHAGLNLDENTKIVLQQIRQVYKNASSGSKGFFMQRLMEMPEYEPILVKRLHHWISHIDGHIR